MILSVVICTHNPLPEHLRRVIESLQTQTASTAIWELLLIDNASREALAGAWDLSWHPHGRHIREEEVGLTVARMRGIRESRGDVVVFVDDDNVLAADFLEQSCTIAERWSGVGVWGGSCVPEFEVEPAEELRGYLDWMAVVDVQDVHVTTALEGPGLRPIGAGMCVRRSIAMSWADETAADRVRRNLGAKGESLMGSEDEDIRISAVRGGFAMGMFPQLSLVHLIPSRRVQPDYMVRLYEDRVYSQMVLAAAHGRTPPHMDAKGLASTAWSVLSRVREPGFVRSKFRRLHAWRLKRQALRRACERFRRWCDESSRGEGWRPR